MNFVKLSLEVNSAAMDGITGLLTELGVTGFELYDSADFEEFLNSKEYSWDYIDDDLMIKRDEKPHIVFYLPDDAQGAEMLALIRPSLEALRRENPDYYGSLALTLENVKEEDWANNWKKYYMPFNVGDKLLIKPSWENVDNIDNRVILEIDPASTFGTGQHYTTKLCLEEIEKAVSPDMKVLDLGCGSGILSIGAMLLGAKSVTFVDIFENAVKTANENLLKNNISPENIRGLCGDITTDESLVNSIGTGFDLVCANIVADVIIAMSGIIPTFMKKEGVLLVSGIISERLDEVVNALTACGFTVQHVREDGGWCAIKLLLQ